MKAQPKKQRQAAGAAQAAKRGEGAKSSKGAKRERSDSMSETEGADVASARRNRKPKAKG